MHTIQQLTRFCHRWLYPIAVSMLLLPSPTKAADKDASVFAAGNTATADEHIKGKVTDKNGTPVAGAFVQVKGDDTSGCLTDQDGIFELTASVPSTIVISSLSYKTEEREITIGGARKFEITLQDDAEQLEEVVIVGYGTQKKTTVTGSVAAVKGKELRRSPESNLTNSLVGRMPGVIAMNSSGEPGADYSEILVRGKATFGNTQPLFVIDGVANRWGNIDNLNPNDIESITVLKDASAAIYGAQAANGVILVTTKRGTSTRPTINYEGSFSLSENTRTPVLMDAYSFMDYRDIAMAYDFPTDPTRQIYKNIKGGYIDGTIDRKQYYDTEWMGVVFQRPAPKTRHSISVSGGNDKVKYYLSGAYLYSEPAYKNTSYNFQTFQIRSNVDAKVTKDLTIGLELATRNEINNRSNYTTGSLFWEAYNAYPYLPDFYDNGLPGPGISAGLNPALMGRGDTGYAKSNDFYVNSKVSVDLQMPWITKGLYVNAYVAFDKKFSQWKRLDDMWHTYRYDPLTDEYNDIYDLTGYQNIQLRQTSQKQDMLTIVAKLGYERRFKNHNISAFVAYEQSSDGGENLGGFRKNFLSSYPDQMFAGADKDKDVWGSAWIYKRQHIFGRASYGYKDKYLAEITLRYDGSMNFPKDKRWGLFPGISLGWRISEENFMKSVTFLDELKLKVSAGKLGNDKVESFQYLGDYELGNGAIFGTDPQMVKGFYLSRVPNPDITWEIATTYNAGFESRFFNSRLSFNAEYFYSERNNILVTRNASVPDYTGLSLPDQNIGRISNQGVEAELMFRDHAGDFNYFAGGTFTFARNKILFFDEAENMPEYQKRTGYPIDSYFLYPSDGIFQNNQEIKGAPHWSNTRPGDIRHLDYDENGTLSGEDIVRYHTSPTPEIVYGISLGLSWKGIEMNALFQGQARASAYIHPGSTKNRAQVYYDDRWTEDNPAARYPRPFSENDYINNLASDFWLYDAWYLRLKNLEIAYNFPKAVMERWKMENLRVYLSGSNLFTIDEIKILDPECANTNGMYYPQQRIYNIGIMLTF